jgi:hypothetical protein
MTRPNLFDFATSELSQDALLCWLVANAGQEERADLRDLGRAFVGWLWTVARGEHVGHEHVRLLGKPKKQFESIDILFEAEVAGRPTTFIIEDKTDTSHHDDQLRRYEGAIRGRGGGEVVCIYFKTGYHFGEDVRAAKDGWTVIGLKEWVVFLHEHHIKHDVFEDYRSYVTRLLEKREADLAALLAPGGHAKLDTDSVQFEFVKMLAESCVETIEGSAVHHGRNMGGAPWTHWTFASFNDGLPGGIGEALFHRVDARYDEKGERRYYVSTRQYAVVKGNPEARGKKLLRLRGYRSAFDQAAKDSDCGLTFSRPAGDNHGANESEIGILFFDAETNTVAALLERFALLHRAFLERVRKAGPTMGAKEA